MNAFYWRYLWMSIVYFNLSQRSDAFIWRWLCSERLLPVCERLKRVRIIERVLLFRGAQMASSWRSFHCIEPAILQLDKLVFVFVNSSVNCPMRDIRLLQTASLLLIDSNRILDTSSHRQRTMWGSLSLQSRSIASTIINRSKYDCLYWLSCTGCTNIHFYPLTKCIYWLIGHEINILISTQIVIVGLLVTPGDTEPEPNSSHWNTANSKVHVF